MTGLAGRVAAGRRDGVAAPQATGRWRPLALLALLATPRVAGLTALAVYLLRALVSPQGLGATDYAYFNLLADAFLHGQLHLRLPSPQPLDLILYGERTYLYWPPLPAILLLPFVALFGAGFSDVLFGVAIGALTIALLARVLRALDEAGVAPLDAGRRGAIVATCAFGTFLLFLVPTGRVWYLAQVIGWGCVLLATLAAIRCEGARGYFLVGLALAGALATRMPLALNGLWLAFYLLRRDWGRPWSARARAIGAGLLPVVLTILALGWYNWARFGSPLETGLAWQQVGGPWRANLARWGQMHPHYLPTNLYHHFVVYPLGPDDRYHGGGFFWTSPLFLGLFAGIRAARRDPFTWVLLASCVAIYLPSGLLNGTGWVTVGPRYLLDLLVPVIILTAIGLRRWRPGPIRTMTIISCLTYLAWSALLWVEYRF